MANITMCLNRSCKLSSQCHRGVAEAGKGVGSVMFKPNMLGNCDHFVRHVVYTSMSEEDKSTIKRDGYE